MRDMMAATGGIVNGDEFVISKGKRCPFLSKMRHGAENIAKM